MKVSVAHAKNRLPQLIRAVENGASVTICRRGKPVVDVVRTERAARQKPAFGTLSAKIVLHDPDWWKPMSEDQVDEFVDGG
jgi:prevent-host-death family protein